MKHVMYAEKSLLMGDEVVDLVMEYAVLLANRQSADSVNIKAIGADGAEVTATFLIGPATIMVAESTTTAMPEPDNATAEEYLRSHIHSIKSPSPAHGLDDDSTIVYDDDL